MNIKKMISLIAISQLFLSCSGCDRIESDDNGEVEPNVTTLKLVDPQATAETKNLYANLWQIQKIGTMFGHHDYAAYGVGWRDIEGKSDVKDVCGKYPAVFSTDLAGVEQNKENNINNIPAPTLKKLIKEVHARGGVTMMSWHQDNPLTGNRCIDDNTRCIDQILIEGSELNIKYKGWLDNVAAFFLDLKDDEGKHIPIIFRMLHEHTQVWSWWGSEVNTEQEFIAFWRLIVTYLRDTKGVHNLIYAISPQMDMNYGTGTADRLKFRWPGDDYVDFLGMDCYSGINTDAFNANLFHVTAASKSLQKPVGVTECGISSNRPVDYWTRYVMNPLLESGVTASMICMWRNESPTHAHAAYPGDNTVADFVTMSRNSRIIFEDALPDMYAPIENIIVE